jgi:ubiquinone/menaquinone biosynthesis C-methylase UbiE
MITLACPSCKFPLIPEPAAGEKRFKCSKCGNTFPLKYGVIYFGETPEYFGELSREEMSTLLELAAKSGWRKAAQTFLPQRNPGLLPTIEDQTRINWTELLDLSGNEIALDYGCGLGGASVPLSRRIATVVSLDGCLERIRFLQLRVAQDSIQNLTTVCSANPRSLPFVDSTFDLVVLNMVFPYFTRNMADKERCAAEEAILKEFARIIRKRGRLYITIRHKFSIHHVLRICQPRVMVFYGYSQFQKLLRQSGFREIIPFWPIPDYKTPVHFLPLNQPLVETLSQLSTLPTFRASKALVAKSLARVGHLHSLAETMAFVATK